jgi:hypothetical protein
VNAADAYPDLSQLLGGYLHQTFGSDAGTADEALRQAVVDTPDERRVAVAAQIESLLAAHRDERSLAIAVNQLCDYYPLEMDFRIALARRGPCVRTPAQRGSRGTIWGTN